MSIVMNLLRSLVAPNNQLSPFDEFKAKGSLYRVIQDSRQNIFEECVITFEDDEEDHWCLHFKNPKEKVNNQYFFPVHSGMNLVTFTMMIGDGQKAYFEWFVQHGGTDIIGCCLDVKDRNQFVDLLCKLIQKQMPNYDKNVSHLTYCREVKGFPVYSNSKQDPINTSENLSLYSTLFQQSQEDNTKLANTGKLFKVVGSSRELQDKYVVFTIKSGGAFMYQMVLFDSQGKRILQKDITPQLNYQINQTECYLKWFHLHQYTNKVNIYLIEFDKYDVTINVRFAFELCMYEMRNNITLEQSLDKQRIEEERAEKQKDRCSATIVSETMVVQVETPFKILKNQRVQKIEKKLNKMMAEECSPLHSSHINSSNLKVESHFTSPTAAVSMNIEEEIIKPFSEENKKQKERKVHLGLQKFRQKRMITQAKIQNYTISSIANQLQFLSITSNNEIKTTSSGKIFDSNQKALTPTKIVMHDGDYKAMMLSEGGHLSYCDLQTLKIIEQYAPEGVQDICPQRKLAQIGDYETFLGITDKGIHRIDPRIGKNAFQYTHDYRRQKKFSHVTTTVEGWIAVGSRQGDIRLYPNQKKQCATSKFSGLGDPVLCLESTKDQRWLLATYKSYLLLLPTFMGESSLFHKKTFVDTRPLAKRLTIKPQHLAMCKIPQLSLIPAHFDESTTANEKYIVSGFNEYVVVWSLNKVITGDYAYTFSKTEESINQAEFRFNDPSKMLMASNHKVRVKENYVG